MSHIKYLPLLFKYTYIYTYIYVCEVLKKNIKSTNKHLSTLKPVLFAISERP